MDIKTLKQHFLSDRYGSRRAARDIPKTVVRMSEFTEAIQVALSRYPVKIGNGTVI